MFVFESCRVIYAAEDFGIKLEFLKACYSYYTLLKIEILLIVTSCP